MAHWSASTFVNTPFGARPLLPFGQQPQVVQKLLTAMHTANLGQTEPLQGARYWVNDLNPAYREERVSLHKVFIEQRMVRCEKLYDKHGPEESQGSIADVERLAHVFSKRAEQLQKIQLRNILRFGARAKTKV